jgi:DNA gyrase inhibitor GyrI
MYIFKTHRKRSLFQNQGFFSPQTAVDSFKELSAWEDQEGLPPSFCNPLVIPHTPAVCQTSKQETSILAYTECPLQQDKMNTNSKHDNKCISDFINV